MVVTKCKRTVISHRIQAGTAGSTVAFLRWLVLWPISSIAWVTLGGNLSNRTAKPNKISQRQKEIPGEDACIVESVGDRIENSHSAVWILGQT